MILFAWLGMTDLRASSGDEGVGLGPIAQAVSTGDFSHLYLFSDHVPEKDKAYAAWLKGRCGISPKYLKTKLSSPTNFRDIYAAVSKGLNEHPIGAKGRCFHLSPGTPAMAAVWILLSKTSHPARLIETQQQKDGYQVVDFPFDLSAEFQPELMAKLDDELIRLTQGLPPAAPEFADIIHRSKEMRRVVALARRLALHDVPVLIQGESGTGKELFARAIHASSLRAKRAFVSVNCGAIPRELFESEFFGHKKGAFTGAVEDRVGHMVTADGGTLFLDEVGELPKEMQVKLLRVLQEGIIRPVGASKDHKVGVRVLAATNRELISEVSRGDFREDLFHRLAVGVMTLPPLRARGGDIGLLIDHALEKINSDGARIPGWEQKTLSAGARNLLINHPWPGNIRELINTLSRAAIWAPAGTIGVESLRESLFPVTGPRGGSESILNRSLGNDLDLRALVAEVERHYLERAMEEAAGNKTLAAKLIGLPNYQTLTNWLKKHDLE